MSFSDYLMPFTKIIEWSRTYELTFGSISFTFFDFWLYVTIVGIVIAFIVSQIDG